MRRMIIDTDTASDDAVALLMALLDPAVQVEAITTVCGNMPLDLATINALATVQVAGRETPPVYEGADRPLFRELKTAEMVHGSNGMGDMDLPELTLSPAPGFAALKIIELVKQYPGELDLVVLGPATNIATALLLDPVAMRGVRHIYSMGTCGFERWGVTPVSEFNVLVDAEAYDIMLRSGIPMTLIGIDQCRGEAALDAEEIAAIEHCGNAVGHFAMRCNYTLIELYTRRAGRKQLGLPDPVAMAAAIWPELVLDAPACYCYTCTTEPMTYGQVIINEHQERALFPYPGSGEPPNATVVREMDYQGFKRKLTELLVNA
ncbi:MAG: nucleoside hydrolase [Oscillospiraceae bacterium]|nr:nucleoside hydrolase [Oscillospiraceae bacterium]